MTYSYIKMWPWEVIINPNHWYWHRVIQDLQKYVADIWNNISDCRQQYKLTRLLAISEYGEQYVDEFRWIEYVIVWFSMADHIIVEDNRVCMI